MHDLGKAKVVAVERYRRTDRPDGDNWPAARQA
jgi:hypothetical protein